MDFCRGNDVRFRVKFQSYPLVATNPHEQVGEDKRNITGIFFQKVVNLFLDLRRKSCLLFSTRRRLENLFEVKKPEIAPTISPHDFNQTCENSVVRAIWGITQLIRTRKGCWAVHVIGVEDLKVGWLFFSRDFLTLTIWMNFLYSPYFSTVRSLSKGHGLNRVGSFDNFTSTVRRGFGSHLELIASPFK